MKSIDTLKEDIYNVFLRSDHKISEDNLEELGRRIKEAVKTSIEKASTPRVPTLRMSVIGKPDRQLWFELNSKDPREVTELPEVDLFEPNPEKFIKFLYGDIIEQLLVFLIKEAGHSFEHQQEQLTVDGIEGSTDGTIDRVPVDIKSASGYSFREKFLKGGLLASSRAEADPFGYKGQLAGYRKALLDKYPAGDIDTESVAWVVLNKETGELHVLKADAMELPDVETRIKEIKSIVSMPEPPKEKCYEDVPQGSSGNRVLARNCVYCPFKEKCWPSLRKFKYADGTKFFTKIVVEPRVSEERD